MSTRGQQSPSEAPDERTRVLRERILEHPFWYHRIDLGDGFYTPGWVDAEKFHELALPDDLTGKSVLDIGSYNGLFAFEAERRGAGRVMATDLWDVDDRELAPEQDHRKRGFDIVHEYLDSDVEARSVDLLDLSPEAVDGTFDIVLCPGVLYRLQHPTVGVENLVSVADEQIVVTSLYPRQTFSEPAMEFYEGPERLNDPSIWWVADEECTAGLFRTMGCDRVETFPLPSDAVDTSTPPVETALVGDRPIDLYRDPGLQERVGRRVVRSTGPRSPEETDGGEQVPVLYRTDDAARIMYSVVADGGMVEQRQAWVDSDVLSQPENSIADEVETLVGAGIDALRSEGPVETARRAVRYALDRQPAMEYGVHAYVER